ncbi:MAG: phage tail protein [Acidimicrobiaceae bacterium]|nr:phage tail protein [Acidimicrobiaceae bacterium]
MPDSKATEKAYIALIQPNSGGGAELGRVTFAYNPKEFSYSKQAKWERKPARGAKSAATPEFKGADPMKLTVEVFLDGYESGTDVSTDIDTLSSCCRPLEDSITSKKPSPPWVIFGWGSQIHLTGIVDTVAVKITLFAPDGTPLRATCTVTIEEVVPDSLPQNPTSGGLTTVRSHLMVAGDTLATVAYREYGRADWWRPLAEANNIDDPMRVTDGTRVLVPDIDDAFAEVR